MANAKMYSFSRAGYCLKGVSLLAEINTQINV